MFSILNGYKTKIGTGIALLGSIALAANQHFAFLSPDLLALVNLMIKGGACLAAYGLNHKAEKTLAK